MDRWLRFCESLLNCDNAPGIPYLEDAAVADPSTALWIIAAGRSVLWRSGANPSRTIRDFLHRCVKRDPNWANRLEEIRRDGANALRPLAAIAQAILESAPGWNGLLNAPSR